MFPSVKTIFEISAIFKYISMLEKETDRENELGFDDVWYSSDMGSFSRYAVSLRYPIKVLDIV